ncbi:MAG: DUF4124 domain-containing protein [Pseudomonadota bacterium]
MIRAVLIALIITLFGFFTHAGTSFSGQLYKWIDENGVVHFTDHISDKSVIRNYDVEVRRSPDYVEPTLPADKEEDQIERKAKEIDKEAEEQEKNYEAHKAQELPYSGKSTGLIRRQEPQPEGTNKTSSYSKPSSKGIRIIPKSTRSKNKPDKMQRKIQKYNAQARKHNTQTLNEYESAKRDYEKRLKEYEKKKREVEEYNAWVDEQNAQKYKGSRPEDSGGYSMRKPYLGDEDPHRPFYQRHPAARR